MNTDETERRVWNWGRWACSAEGGVHSCASAERRYVPPRADEAEAEKKAREPLDVRDAERVELAITRMRFGQHRRLLVDFYCWRLPKQRLLKKYSTTQDLLDAARWSALGAVSCQLEAVDAAEAAKRQPLALRKPQAYKVHLQQ